MSRVDLIQALAVEHPNLSAEEVKRIVRLFFDLITTKLTRGGRVEIRGFGSFETRVRDARTGRNPGNGASVAVEAKRVPNFKPGRILRELIEASVTAATMVE